MSQPKPEVIPASHSMSQPLPPMASPPETTDIESLAPAQALELLIADPFAFVRQIVADAAQTHLADLKEEAELKSALNAFRKKSPEFKRFEPFILQEVVTLLREDPEGGTASWEELIEQGMALFQQKFQATLQAQQDEALEAGETGKQSRLQAPHIEAAGKRAMPTMPSSFTRQQIAGMSMGEFLKNEAAINEAMKNNRVR
ncbi:hypothetical protein [Vampirovibrio sp.]|uniref:hypothetical protein n=1 Tax=Vampirovibrio sp. TaxID=2717857 RepID=UPI003593CA01